MQKQYVGESKRDSNLKLLCLYFVGKKNKNSNGHEEEFETGEVDSRCGYFFLKIFCWTKVHFVGPLIAPILYFV